MICCRFRRRLESGRSSGCQDPVASVSIRWCADSAAAVWSVHKRTPQLSGQWKQWILISFAFKLMVALSVSAAVWNTIEHSSDGFLSPVDSFDVQCQGNKSFLYYVSPQLDRTTSLSICVHQCPISEIDMADAYHHGFCFNKNQMEKIPFWKLRMNHIYDNGNYIGCPSSIYASKNKILRCIPAQSAIDFDLNFLQDLKITWPITFIIVPLAAILANFLVGVRILLNPRTIGITVSAILAITSARLVRVTNVLRFQTDSSQEVTSNFNSALYVSLFWVSIVLNFGNMLLYGVCRRRVRNSNDFLLAWLSAHHRRGIKLALFQATVLCVLVGHSVILLVGLLSDSSGCHYPLSPTKEDTCRSNNRVIPFVCALISWIWMYYFLHAFQAAVVSRGMALDFFRHTHKFKESAAIEPALLNAGRLAIDAVVTFFTTPFRLFVGLRIGQLGKHNVLEIGKFTSRLNAIDAGMDRDSSKSISFIIMSTFQSNPTFSSSATIAGDLVVWGGPVAISSLTWNSIDMYFQASDAHVTHPPVIGCIFAALAGVVSHFVLSAVRTGCDTLALLALVEASCRGSESDIPFVLAEAMGQQFSLDDELEIDTSDMTIDSLPSEANNPSHANLPQPPSPPNSIHQPSESLPLAVATPASSPRSGLTDAVPRRRSARWSDPAVFDNSFVDNTNRLSGYSTRSRRPPSYSEWPSYVNSRSIRNSGQSATNSERMSEIYLCRVCGESTATQVLFPCKHLCMCQSCVNQLRSASRNTPQRCPICRSVFLSVTPMLCS